jgi:CheY-like chemotaxis protein
MAGETILAIDDSPTVRKLMEMILSTEGYRIITAADGMEGIAKAKVEEPAVVLVDFVMPKMNGFQVCKAIKETANLKDTPIILVTSKGETVGSKFVDLLGIREYFTKPFQPEDLLEKIREVIDRSPRPAAAAETLVATAEPVITAETVEEAEAVPAAPIERAAPTIPSPEAPALPPIPGLEERVEALVRGTLQRFFKEEFPSIVRSALPVGLGSSSEAGAQSEKNISLSGDLSLFPLPDILQLISMQKRTGRLWIGTEENQAETFFEDGRVVFAALEHKPPEDLFGRLLMESSKINAAQLRHALADSEKSGVPLGQLLIRGNLIAAAELLGVVRTQTQRTVYRTLGWKSGRFAFSREPLPAVFAGTGLSLGVDDLILEGVRRIDEWQVISQKLPSLNIILTRLISNADEMGKINLNPSEVKVLLLVDAKRDIKAIIRDSGMGDFEVCKILYVLMSTNLLKKIGETERPRRTPQFL